MLSDLSLLDYQPMERRKYSTIKAGYYLYMLGGWQSGLPKVHGSEKKKLMSSVMELCHFPSGRLGGSMNLHWTTHPLGVRGYAAIATRNEIYFFEPILND